MYRFNGVVIRKNGPRRNGSTFATIIINFHRYLRMKMKSRWCGAFRGIANCQIQRYVYTRECVYVNYPFEYAQNAPILGVECFVITVIAYYVCICVRVYLRVIAVSNLHSEMLSVQEIHMHTYVPTVQPVLRVSPTKIRFAIIKSTTKLWRKCNKKICSLIVTVVLCLPPGMTKRKVSWVEVRRQNARVN